MNKSVFITVTTNPCPEDKISEYIKELSELGVDYVHFDVMDGKFVPAVTMGYAEIKKEISKAPPQTNFAIHLMVSEPQGVIDKYIECKAKYIIVHYEAFKNNKDLVNCLKKINKSSTIAGIALNPETPVSVLKSDLIKNVGLVMIMGVTPGKSGQEMKVNTFEKIKQVNAMNSDIFIAVDGGINNSNIFDAISAGADFISMGSYFYKLVKEGKAKEFLEQF